MQPGETMGRSSRRVAGVAGIVCALSIGLSVGASAQIVIAPVDTIRFDRPEAWALKYFTSTTLLSGLGVPDTVQPGSIRIGFEFASIPALSPTQERVGFNGTKQEDLNKAPMFARPRVTVGLPWRLSLIVAASPPIKTFGITPRLLAVGLERPMVAGAGWSAGWRVSGQAGTATGAYTCPAGVLTFDPGSAGNSYGCQALSSDVATLRYAAGELAVARRIERMHGLTPHASVTVAYMNSMFHVNALTFGYLDRTLLKSTGVTWSVSAGVGHSLTERISAAIDVFYSPLSVVRAPNSPSAIDGLLNVRGLISYRVHR
jgi:hypothetical protein